MRTRPPDQAGLLADDGEDEVGLGVRQVAVAGDAGPEPLAEHVSVAQGQQGLHRLVAGIAGVFERMKERRQPPPPVRAPRWRGTRPAAAPAGQQAAERLERDARRDHHGHADAGQHDGRAHVGLGHDQQRPAGQDGDDRNHLVAPVAAWPPGDRECRPRRGPGPAWPAPTGCTCRDEVPSHLDAPEARTPMPGTSTANSRPMRRVHGRRVPAGATAGGRPARRRGSRRMPTPATSAAGRRNTRASRTAGG